MDEEVLSEGTNSRPSLGSNPVPTRGRPPLPPSGAKPNPYLALSKIQPSAIKDNKISRDANFAENDWDDYDGTTRDDEKEEQSGNSGSSRGKTSSISPKNTIVINGGVRADVNWLNNNFDDD